MEPIVLFDGKLMPYSDIPASLLERAWLYGDRLFESMVCFEGKIPFLSNHINRLHAGVKAQGMLWPDHWNVEFWMDEFQKLELENARIRLLVVRAAGGYYQASQKGVHSLVQVSPLTAPAWSWPDRGLEMGLAADIRIPADRIGRYKTHNASRYVVAMEEAREQGWDDVFIQNIQNEVAEASSSNVFCWIENTLITPPLESGCVAGVAREIICAFAQSQGLVVRENPLTFAMVLQSDECFLCNAVQGIRPVVRIGQRSFPSNRTQAFAEALRAHYF
ncbi:MAG: aminotransferase class IV [Saprospiraceae bacterium]